MNQLSAAEQYLLEQTRRADAQAWQQLVARYQGRLFLYAQQELPDQADADDVVQETFLGFLQSLPGFRGEASLETFLFRILRRRIAEFFRRRGRRPHHVASGLPPAIDDQAPPTELHSPLQTASWYVRREEQRAGLRQALAAAVQRLVSELQDPPRFQDLQLIELLLGSLQRNKDVAARMRLSEQQVALRKHRLIQRLSRYAAEAMPDSIDGDDLPDPLDTFLSQTWADFRPTCPKRSTLGKFLLQTLDPAWTQYVGFHLEQVCCPFCRANLHDLQSAMETRQTTEATSHILRSTIGFFRPG